jgi:hypothetical protein
MPDVVPLIIAAGQIRQMQAGDTISTTLAPGTGGAGADIAVSKNQPAVGQTIAAQRSAYLAEFYEIVDTFFLDIGDDSVFEIG